MKRLVLWLLLAAVTLGVRAQTPDAEFLAIYEVIQQAESREGAGEFAAARDRYQSAQDQLKRFAKSHPFWNPKIIQFRTEYLAGKLERLADVPRTQPAATPGSGPVAAKPVPSPAPAPPPSLPPAAAPAPDPASAQARLEAAEWRAAAAESRLRDSQRETDNAIARANTAEDRVAQLALDLRHARDRVDVLAAEQRNLERLRDQLEADRTTLQAKLNEALSPQPAALTPAELAKAEERNRLLMKENEILKASLDRQMAENQRMADLAKRATSLEQERNAALAEVASQRREVDDLRSERTKLLARLEQAGRRDSEQVASLNREIESLRKDLASARSSRGARGESQDLASVRQELASQKEITRGLREENAGLLREMEKLTAINVTPASLRVPEVKTPDPNLEAARLRYLERERQELLAEVQELRARSPRPDPSLEARARTLESEVSRLSAKVDALEANPEPYSPEELALFQAPARRETMRPLQVAQAAPATQPAPAATPAAAPAPTPATPPATPTQPDSVAPTNTPSATPATAAARRRTAADLPAGAGILASQAQRAFSQRRFDEAERAYREILKLDESNVFTLGNLAAILTEQGRLADAEAFVVRALEIDAQDPFCLSLLGIMRFRQQRYDEAFDALSRSASLDPENSETQNYLGITLSQRGQRKAAEAALRKALKINPASASAHYNLAVVYATQKPPFMELARYHYEKARRGGQPANAAFEQLLKSGGEPANPAPPTP